MDKKEAIQFLRAELGEIPTLAELPYNNDDYPLWRKQIEDVLEDVFNRDSTEYQRFAEAYPNRLRTSSADHSAEKRWYLDEVKMCETALKSIIRKYELLGIETKQSIEVLPEEIFREVPPKAFISHGKDSAALRKLKVFLETLGIEPIIVKIQASLDKTVGDKVEYYLNQADFVIALATADDEVDGKMQPRQNVSHEIGLAQKTHKGRIIYLLEEGAEFGSNISPKVYERFKQRNMMDAFLSIVRELRAYGMLKIIKTPLEE